MKVCMFLKSEYDSFMHDSRVLREASALIAEGYDVSVLLYGNQDTNLTYNGIDVRIVGLKSKCNIENARIKMAQGGFKRFYYSLMEHIHARFFHREYLEKTLKAAISLKAGIYHCHDVETLSLGAKIKDPAAKVILDSHELWIGTGSYSGFKGWLRKWLTYPLIKKRLNKIDRVITVNQSIAQILKDFYRIKEVEVLKNVPELKPASSTSDKLRKELAIPWNKKIVLYQGRLSANRGLENLLKAWEHVNENIVLVIMGSGELYGWLGEKIRTGGLPGRIYLKPAVSAEVLHLYTRGADLGVITVRRAFLNYYYCLPNKVFEYISCSVPIIASRFPELEKLASGDGLGLTVDPESPEDIAAKINYALDESRKEFHNTMKQNCLRASKYKYNWSIEKKVLLRIYKELSR